MTWLRYLAKNSGYRLRGMNRKSGFIVGIRSYPQPGVDPPTQDLSSGCGPGTTTMHV